MSCFKSFISQLLSQCLLDQVKSSLYFNFRDWLYILFLTFKINDWWITAFRNSLTQVIIWFSETDFEVGGLVDLELEFRTSEMNGILLSVAEPQDYPAMSLELDNGKVSNNQQQSITGISVTFSSPLEYNNVLVRFSSSHRCLFCSK